MANSKSTPGNANLRIGRPRAQPAPQLEPDPNIKPAITENGVPREWHSRGYLPHFDHPHATQHVTFHLADSLPQTVLLQLDAELNPLPAAKRDVERRMRIEAWIDAGHGSCILRKPAIARMVQNSLLAFDSQRYRLLAWVVMPNHVHVLFESVEGWTVANLVASWKKFTATRIRSTEGGTRAVWHREYWDRYIRDHAHLLRTIEYIQQNPVKAHLTTKAEDWPWSSAHHPGNANLRIGRPQPQSESQPNPKTAIAENGAPRQTHKTHAKHIPRCRRPSPPRRAYRPELKALAEAYPNAARTTPGTPISVLAGPSPKSESQPQSKTAIAENGAPRQTHKTHAKHIPRCRRPSPPRRAYRPELKALAEAYPNAARTTPGTPISVLAGPSPKSESQPQSKTAIAEDSAPKQNP